MISCCGRHWAIMTPYYTSLTASKMKTVICGYAYSTRTRNKVVSRCFRKKHKSCKLITTKNSYLDYTTFFPSGLYAYKQYGFRPFTDVGTSFDSRVEVCSTLVVFSGCLGRCFLTSGPCFNESFNFFIDTRPIDVLSCPVLIGG